MARVAYRDEYPTIRCSCGWLLNWDSHDKPCTGCGETVGEEQVQFLDRFGPLSAIFTVSQGTTWRNVPYEDAYRDMFSRRV